MSDRDPYDKVFGFDKPAEYWPIERPKRKFSLRNHWVLWLLLVNCISFFVILFFYSGGHPIEYVSVLLRGEPALTEEELLLQDAQQIRKAVSFSKGENVMYSVHRYTGDAMWEVYYKNDKIKNAPGNSFTQLPSGYYYLSGDRQRLYKCLIDEPKMSLPPVFAKPIPQPAPRLIPKPKPEPEYEYVDEFYKAPDGTWKNQKVKVEVKVDVTTGKEDTIPKWVIEDRKRREQMRIESEIRLEEMHRRMREDQRIADEKKRVGDISSYERFDASQVGEVKSEWENFDDPRDQK